MVDAITASPVTQASSLQLQCHGELQYHDCHLQPFLWLLRNKVDGEARRDGHKSLQLLFLPRSSTTESKIPESTCLPALLALQRWLAFPITSPQPFPFLLLPTWQPILSDVATRHFILLLHHLGTAIPLPTSVVTQGLPWSATSKRKENLIFYSKLLLPQLKLPVHILLVFGLNHQKWACPKLQTPALFHTEVFL